MSISDRMPVSRSTRNPTSTAQTSTPWTSLDCVVDSGGSHRSKCVMWRPSYARYLDSESCPAARSGMPALTGSERQELRPGARVRVPPAVPLGVLPGRAIGEQPAQRADQPVHVLDGAAQVGRVGDRTGNGHRDGEMTGSESSPPGLTVPGPAARETLLPQGHVCRSFRSVMLAHAGGNG